MIMATAFWDIIGKAANLFQLLGLDAITLIIAISTALLRPFHENEKECRKLEERVRTLCVLLLTPGGCWIMQQQQQQHDDLLDLLGLLQVTNVLRDAHGLMESYKRSTLYSRVIRRSYRGMATRFRDLRTRIDSYCGLILAVNAFLLVVRPNRHPPLLDVRTQGNDVAGESPSSTVDSIDAVMSNAPAPDVTHIIDINRE